MNDKPNGPVDIDAIVDVAAAGSPQPHVVSQSIQDAVPEGAETLARPYVYAFGYMDVTKRREELRESAGFAFAPMIEFDGKSFPPPLEALPEEDLEALAEYVSPEKAAVSRARINDLIWERRFGLKPHEAAIAAIDGYIDVAAESEWHPVRKSDALGRALELAVTLGNAELIARCADVGVTHVREAIADTKDWNPGVAMHLLEPLVALSPKYRPEAVGDLVKSARARYGEDPFILEELTQMSISLGNDRFEESEAAVRAFLKAADDTTGLTRYMNLRNAFERAKTYGLSGLVDEIAVLIQAVEFDPEDFGTISAPIELTKEDLDEAAAPVLEAISLTEGVRFLGLFDQPVQTDDEIRKSLEVERVEFPLQALIPKFTIGPSNAPGSPPEDPEARLTHDVVERRALGIRIRSLVTAEVIDRLLKQFDGELDVNAISSAFDATTITEKQREKFAEAFAYFARGEYDTAVHIAIPRIEAVVRQMCESVGIRVIKVTPGLSAGDVVGLGALLDKLEGRMPEELRLFLIAALTHKRGVNLRNRVSHGLAEEFGRTEAAAAVEIAAMLANLSRDRGQDQPEE